MAITNENFYNHPALNKRKSKETKTRQAVTTDSENYPFIPDPFDPVDIGSCECSSNIPTFESINTDLQLPRPDCRLSNDECSRGYQATCYETNQLNCKCRCERIPGDDGISPGDLCDCRTFNCAQCLDSTGNDMTNHLNLATCCRVCCDEIIPDPPADCTYDDVDGLPYDYLLWTLSNDWNEDGVLNVQDQVLSIQYITEFLFATPEQIMEDNPEAASILGDRLIFANACTNETNVSPIVAFCSQALEGAYGYLCDDCGFGGGTAELTEQACMDYLTTLPSYPDLFWHQLCGEDITFASCDGTADNQEYLESNAQIYCQANPTNCPDLIEKSQCEIYACDSNGDGQLNWSDGEYGCAYLEDFNVYVDSVCIAGYNSNGVICYSSAESCENMGCPQTLQTACGDDYAEFTDNNTTYSSCTCIAQTSNDAEAIAAGADDYCSTNTSTNCPNTWAAVGTVDTGCFYDSDHQGDIFGCVPLSQSDWATYNTSDWPDYEPFCRQTFDLISPTECTLQNACGNQYSSEDSTCFCDEESTDADTCPAYCTTTNTTDPCGLVDNVLGNYCDIDWVNNNNGNNDDYILPSQCTWADVPNQSEIEAQILTQQNCEIAHLSSILSNPITASVSQLFNAIGGNHCFNQQHAVCPYDDNDFNPDGVGVCNLSYACYGEDGTPTCDQTDDNNTAIDNFLTENGQQYCETMYKTYILQNFCNIGYTCVDPPDSDTYIWGCEESGNPKDCCYRATDVYGNSTTCEDLGCHTQGADTTEENAQQLLDYINQNNEAKRLSFGDNIINFTLPKYDMNGSEIEYGDAAEILNASLYGSNPDTDSSASNISWGDILNPLSPGMNAFGSYDDNGVPHFGGGSFTAGSWFIYSFIYDSKVSYYFQISNIPSGQAWLKWTIPNLLDKISGA